MNIPKMIIKLTPMIIIVISIIIGMLIMSGCTGMKPYAEIQFNYALPFSTDYWQHSDRSWQCEQPQFRGEYGLETKNGWGMGVYHESMLLCGTFNTKPEIYENGILIQKRWGGY